MTNPNPKRPPTPTDPSKLKSPLDPPLVTRDVLRLSQSDTPSSVTDGTAASVLQSARRRRSRPWWSRQGPWAGNGLQGSRSRTPLLPACCLLVDVS